MNDTSTTILSQFGRHSIIYDGDCPYCRSYTNLLKLRETLGEVELVNAREDSPRVRALQEVGYDLQEGMIFISNGVVHYGSDAMYALSIHTDRQGIANRVVAFVFRHRFLARWLYPVLKLGRRATLKMLGREPISHPENLSSGPKA